MKQEKSAGAVIFYEDGNKIYFLLLKYPTYWGFAKGWLEENETEEEAAIREIEEEAGIKVKLIPGFRHEQKWFFRMNGELIHKEAAFFLAEVSNEQAGNVKISKEHDDFKWLEYDEAIKIMKVKANKEMLTSALKFIQEYKKQRSLV